MQANMNFKKRLNKFVFCTLDSRVGSSFHAVLVVLSLSTKASSGVAGTRRLELSEVFAAILKQRNKYE